MKHDHDQALDALCGCAATVTVLSYQEAIEGYFVLRGVTLEQIDGLCDSKPCRTALRKLVDLTCSYANQSHAQIGDAMADQLIAESGVFVRDELAPPEVDHLLTMPHPRWGGPSLPAGREAIARIIEPSLWARRDFDAGRKDYYEAFVKVGWSGMPFEQWVERGTQESLCKADAILAIGPSVAGSGE